MRSWTKPVIPLLPGVSHAPMIFDTSSGKLMDTRPVDVARLYVCGITPYDTTHMGHAATYIAYDTLQRVWIDAGFRVHYTQNVTDVDDPLFERAMATGVDWRDLANDQVELFRTDMEALSVLPPDDYIAVTDIVDQVAAAVKTLWERGFAYPVSADGAEGNDIYFDTAQTAQNTSWHIGLESNLDTKTMLKLFAERGGDPERRGKRNPLDPLLWRALRPGEPAWPSLLGPGRPGWHIECSVIGFQYLGTNVMVQGGGTDLIFPHHEMTAGHTIALSGHRLAQIFCHTGLVSYQGQKMSKSLGNLVRVSELQAAGVDTRAMRLAILAHHYRSSWEWTSVALNTATERLSRWSITLLSTTTGNISAQAVIDKMRFALHNDLDTPLALLIVDEALSTGVDDPALLRDAINALLGIQL
jgi:L-cysteine:1D-myo-inositol 2-amino-2-deoxy-alpha-D-glucopyranoside ligase